MLVSQPASANNELTLASEEAQPRCNILFTVRTVIHVAKGM